MGFVNLLIVIILPDFWLLVGYEMIDI